MQLETEWLMPSNSGRALARFRAVAFNKDTDLFRFALFVTGQFACILDCPDKDGDVYEFNVETPTLLIARSTCEQLLNDLTEWMKSNTPFTRTLCSSADQKCEVQLDTRADIISRVDHPAFTLFYDVFGFRYETFFIVDQSCVQIAKDGLYSILNNDE